MYTKMFFLNAQSYESSWRFMGVFETKNRRQVTILHSKENLKHIFPKSQQCDLASIYQIRIPKSNFYNSMWSIFTLLSVSCELVLNLALAPSRVYMGHLFKLNCAHSPLNLRVLSSTIVPFTLTTVQLPNLALTHTKRITVYQWGWRLECWLWLVSWPNS